jgi:hypothetical protein
MNNQIIIKNILINKTPIKIYKLYNKILIIQLKIYNFINNLRKTNFHLNNQMKTVFLMNNKFKNNLV